MKKHILSVDDEQDIRELLQESLSMRGYRVSTAANPDEAKKIAKADRPDLTTRELEVLQLIVHGKSNKEIAIVLSLSANTVAVHRANIMQTLGIHNTAELVVYAIRNGLVSIA